MTSEIDIADDLATGTGNVGLVIDQARVLWALEKEITALKLLLKGKEIEHRIFTTITLPELMRTEGVNNVGLSNGYKLLVEDVYRGNIPAEGTIEDAEDEERELLSQRRDDGLKWLHENKAGDVIRTEIKLEFAPSENKLVKLVMAALAALQLFKVNGKTVSLVIKKKESVHPATLSKLLKEKRDIGVEVPIDTFAIFDGKVAKLKKPPKKGKEKQ